MNINKLFKNYALKLFKQQLDANLELHVHGKLTAVERPVFNTKWISKAWERLKKQEDLVKHSFKNTVYLTI